MREVCFCGWHGALEERDLVYAGDGEWGLECPGCRHLDRVSWLPAHLRDDIFSTAHHRQRTAR